MLYSVVEFRLQEISNEKYLVIRSTFRLISNRPMDREVSDCFSHIRNNSIETCYAIRARAKPSEKIRVNFVMHILHEVLLLFVSLFTRIMQLIMTHQGVTVIMCVI
jgi:hypothetical protein